MRLFGVHTSVKKSLLNAIREADELTCTTFQIFLQSPRVWNFDNSRGLEEIVQFKNQLSKKNFSEFYVHCSYLINPLSKSKDVREKSLRMLEKELLLSDRIGAKYYVLHLRGRKDIDKNSQLEELISEVSQIRLPSLTEILIENMPASKLTARIEDLAFTLNYLRSTYPVFNGVCVDSCHLFAAGYDLKKISADELFNLLHLVIDDIKLVHLNDSKFEAGRGTDRHEHLGKGKIGIDGLKKLVCLEGLDKVPVILETPKPDPEADIRNLEVLKTQILKC